MNSYKVLTRCHIVTRAQWAPPCVVRSGACSRRADDALMGAVEVRTPCVRAMAARTPCARGGFLSVQFLPVIATLSSTSFVDDGFGLHLSSTPCVDDGLSLRLLSTKFVDDRCDQCGRMFHDTMNKVDEVFRRKQSHDGL